MPDMWVWARVTPGPQPLHLEDEEIKPIKKNKDKIITTTTTTATIKTKIKTKIQCECSGSYTDTKSNKASHMKSNKHHSYIYQCRVDDIHLSLLEFERRLEWVEGKQVRKLEKTKRRLEIELGNANNHIRELYKRLEPFSVKCVDKCSMSEDDVI